MPGLLSSPGTYAQTAACIAAVCFVLGWTDRAHAGMDQALSHCLDSALSIDDRAIQLQQDGWAISDGTELTDAALIHALLISGLKPTEPDGWAESQEKAQTIAERLRSRRGYDAATTLFLDDHVVTIEPNGSGLSTCLYVGPSTDLQAAKAMIPDAPLRMTGPMSLLRGETSNGVLIAYSLPTDLSDRFPDPLEYLATFTVVLDRTEGSSS